MRVWTNHELFAVCLVYCMIVQRDRLGARMNKAAMRRALRRGPCADRSDVAIDRKLSVIASCASAHDMTLASGYKPHPQGFPVETSYWLRLAHRIIDADTAFGVVTDVEVAAQATV